MLAWRWSKERPKHVAIVKWWCLYTIVVFLGHNLPGTCKLGILYHCVIQSPVLSPGLLYIYLLISRNHIPEGTQWRCIESSVNNKPDTWKKRVNTICLQFIAIFHLLLIFKTLLQHKLWSGWNAIPDLNFLYSESNSTSNGESLGQKDHSFMHSFNHSFIHWHVKNVTIPCCSRALLSFLSVVYSFPPSYSTNWSSILPYFALPSISRSTSQPCCFKIHT